jgi:hypothetical protein
MCHLFVRFASIPELGSFRPLTSAKKSKLVWSLNHVQIILNIRYARVREPVNVALLPAMPFKRRAMGRVL